LDLPSQYGIVVVENAYRLMSEEGMSRIEAAKKGIGEIAFPIIISTLTTVAAFIPLGLWPGVMGEFMKYFPITLSVVLGSSLFVAIFFNSVLVSQYMTIEDKEMPLKNIIKLSIIIGGIGLLILFFGGEHRALGSVMVFFLKTNRTKLLPTSNIQKAQILKKQMPSLKISRSAFIRL